MKRTKVELPLSDVYMHLNLWLELILRRPWFELEDVGRMRRVCKSFAVHGPLSEYIKSKTDVVFRGIHPRHWNRISVVMDDSFIPIERNIWSGDHFICQCTETYYGTNIVTLGVFSRKQLLVNVFKTHYIVFCDESFWMTPFGECGVAYGNSMTISYEYCGIVDEIQAYTLEYASHGGV